MLQRHQLTNGVSSSFSHTQTWQAGMNNDASRPARLRTAVACCRCQHDLRRSLQHLELLPPPQVAEHSVQSLQSCGTVFQFFQLEFYIFWDSMDAH